MGNSNHKYRVLLVDDDKLIRYVTTVYFKRIGFVLDLAENGSIAVNKYKEKEYDLILMDVRMPVMNGLEATRVIRKMEEENKTKKKTVIVAITASSEKEECIESGMNDYYQKPILMDHIHQMLRQMS